MKKILLLFFLTVTISNTCFSQYDDYADWMWRWDINSMPALGFFPLGGASFDEFSVSTYITGSSLHIYGFDIERDDFQERFAFLNLSMYLIGLNYAALDPNSPASFFQIGYARLGPHYRFTGIRPNGSFAIGGQIGYGFLLEGNTTTARSKVQHGLDVSFTFSWTPFVPVNR